MKFVLITILLLACPSTALTDSQQAYIDGKNAGWNLCYAKMTNVQEYNRLAQQYNDGLNVSLGANATMYLIPLITESSKFVSLGSGKQDTGRLAPDSTPRTYGMPSEAYYSMKPYDSELASIASQMGIT